MVYFMLFNSKISSTMSGLVRRLDITCPARLNTRSEGELLPITTNTDLATLARAGKVLLCANFLGEGEERGRKKGREKEGKGEEKKRKGKKEEIERVYTRFDKFFEDSIYLLVESLALKFSKYMYLLTWADNSIWNWEYFPPNPFSNLSNKSYWVPLHSNRIFHSN